MHDEITQTRPTKRSKWFCLAARSWSLSCVIACTCIWYCSCGDSVGACIGGGACAIVLSANLGTRGLFRDSTGAGAAAGAIGTTGATGSTTTTAAGAAGGALGARLAFGTGGGGGSGIGSTACGMGSGVGSTTCAIGSMVSFGLLREPGGRPLPLLARSASGSGCSMGSIFFIWRKKTHLFKRRRVTRPRIAGAFAPAPSIAFPRAVWGIGWVRNVGRSVFLVWSRY